MTNLRFLHTGVGFAFVAFLAVTGCRERSSSAGSSTDASDSLSQVVMDSTIYGQCGEAGMSTFCLITDKGDTIYVTRTGEDGTYGEIWGDVDEGSRFAMTMKRGEQSLTRAINLTQLNTFIGQYLISNGNLVLRNGEQTDTVQIKWLDADSLVVQSSSGKNLRFLPMKSEN